MRAAVLREVGAISLEDLDLPQPGPGEVRVKVRAVGVCRSDLSVYRGMVSAPLPIVLGHEGAGVIDAVGDGVHDLARGDHVVMTITPGCGTCPQCQLGAFALCEGGSPHMLDGKLARGQQRLHKGSEVINHFILQSSFAEYAVIDRWAAVKIPDDVPFDIACLTACGVTTGFGAVVNRAAAAVGESVLVIGAGELARDLGATDVVLVDDTTDLVPQTQARTGRGVDVAVDAVGTPGTVADAFNSLRKGGRAVVIGVADASAMVSIPLYSLIDERVLTGSTNGSIRPHVDIPRILDLYRSGRLALDKLVTRRYRLDDLERAFAELGVQPGRAVITF
jgi:Zn-dependent alcohol dehydrogenase